MARVTLFLGVFIMAFTKEAFLPNSGQANSDAPRIWNYRTEDASADLTVAGYFSEKFDDINDGDFLLFQSSDLNSFGHFVKNGNVQLSINPSTFNPTTDMTVERLIDGASLAANQQPTGLGEAGQIQVEFGAAQGTSLDPVQLLADGTIRINEAGTYRIKVSFVFGRVGGGGTSKLRFRALINGFQAGNSVGGDVPNSNSENPYSDEAWLTVPAGIDVTYQVMRDSSGSDAGGLFQPEITNATAPSWNPVPCAAIRVERWV